MKRWMIYLLVLVFTHVYYFAIMNAVSKQFWDSEKEETSAHYFSPNWNNPRTNDIFMVKDTLGVIRYYKIVDGVKDGVLSLKAGKYPFHTALKERIFLKKLSFELMNSSELYADSTQQYSLTEFLRLKENVYLTRGFGRAPTKSSYNPSYVKYIEYMNLVISIVSFFIIWFFGFVNSYLSGFTRFSEKILLVIFSVIVTYFWSKDFLSFLYNPSAYFLTYTRGVIYAFILLYLIKALNRKLIKKWSFSNQEAARFLVIVAGGSIISVIGAYFQMSITNLFGINLLIRELNSVDALGFHIFPFHTQFWLVLATGNFLNNFRKHFFQLRRKASAFKYARTQELEFKSELETLQAKINPHFLYNSLNSIASLAQSDPQKTENMAIALSKFYKEKTNRKERIWSTVSEELEMLQTYLSIEKIRFGDRLEVIVHRDETLGDEKLPRFLLQPLIENAIKYGYRSEYNRIVVKIKIERQKGNLIFRIFDSGPPFSEELYTGYGIRSVQKKLKLFYPDHHKMAFINHPEKQVFIQIKL